MPDIDEDNKATWSFSVGINMEYLLQLCNKKLSV